MACGEPHMTFKFSDGACGVFFPVFKRQYMLYSGVSEYFVREDFVTSHFKSFLPSNDVTTQISAACSTVAFYGVSESR